MSGPTYLFAIEDKPVLDLFEIPLIKATEESIREYGCLVDHPGDYEIEIVQWPAQGWRAVDEDSGNEGGWVEGVFYCDWKGDVLYGSNNAVNGNYVLGRCANPQTASSEHQTVPRERVSLWHMNYHPDGGQLFYPMENQPFVVPLALPGDDLKPDKVVAFWFDGASGLYIHPDIWHEGLFPIENKHRFLDRQGRVHGRVSCDFGEEFGCYLSVPLTPP